MPAALAWHSGATMHQLDGEVRGEIATLFHVAEDAEGGSQEAWTFPAALLPNLRRLVERLEQGGEQLELFGDGA